MHNMSLRCRYFGKENCLESRGVFRFKEYNPVSYFRHYPSMRGNIALSYFLLSSPKP